jgi:hypothetical protein
VNYQEKTTSWWLKIGFGSGLSRPVNRPTEAADDAEGQHWWLLPGDAAYVLPEMPHPRAE